MKMRIRSSPKLRERKPERKQEPEHRFIVRDKSDGPGRIGATTILKVGIGAIVFLAAGLAIFSAMQGPDPHYLKAKKLVHDYEFGKPAESRNYEHRIYGDALAELDRVDPRSKSADAAESLRIEIEQGIADFRRRQAEIENGLQEAAAKKRRREAVELEARNRARDFPQVEYPECDEEEIGGHKEAGHARPSGGASL